MKILSFDQSSVSTGVAVFVDDKLTKYDLIDLKKQKDIKIRFVEMITKINDYIISENPNVVVFEDVSLQTNVSTLLLLAQLQGAIMQSCATKGIPFTIYKPTHWRKALKFNQGRNVKRPELKQQSKDYILKKYGLTLKDDLTDAICIGEAFILENKN